MLSSFGISVGGGTKFVEHDDVSESFSIHRPRLLTCR
jgi:hypothetical protein